MAYNPNNPNGSATSVNSSPVVIASDQAPIAMKGYDTQDDMLKIKSMQKKFRDSFVGTSVDGAKLDKQYRSRWKYHRRIWCCEPGEWNHFSQYNISYFCGVVYHSVQVVVSVDDVSAYCQPGVLCRGDLC